MASFWRCGVSLRGATMSMAVVLAAGCAAHTIGPAARISAVSGGGEGWTACADDEAPNGECVAVFMRKFVDGQDEPGSCTEEGMPKAKPNRVVWNHGDPADLQAWKNKEQVATATTTGWARVPTLSTAGITNYTADPIVDAIPMTAGKYPLDPDVNQGPLARTRGRFAAHADACGDNGEGIGFVISDDGGATWRDSEGVDVSAGGLAGARDKSQSAVDPKTGVDWVFFTIKDKDKVLHRYVRWVFAPPGPNPHIQVQAGLNELGPYPTEHPGPGGHVAMTITHFPLKSHAGIDARAPVIHIAQSDQHLPGTCDDKSDLVTWSLASSIFMGTSADPDPKMKWQSPTPVIFSNDERHCAADGTDATESDGNYKINSVPQFRSIENDSGAAFFVAFPETDAGQSRIHVWSARWDAQTNTIGAWHDSTVPVTRQSTGQLNQWRPTLAVTRSPKAGIVLAVQWMETEFVTGHGVNPPTRPLAAFAVVPDSDEAGATSLVWRALATDLLPPKNGQPGTFRYGSRDSGVDYSGSASIAPITGSQFPNGGFLFTWVALDKATDSATTVFARSVAF